MSHSKRTIVAVDIDGTLTKTVCFTNDQVRKAKPLKRAVEKVNALYRNAFVVMYTARRDELLYETILWLKKHGFQYHALSNIKMPFDAYYDNDAKIL